MTTRNRIRRDRPILHQRSRCFPRAFEIDAGDPLVLAAPSERARDKACGSGENPSLAGIEAYHLH